MEISKEILEKHALGIEAARKYWVTNEPTNMLDRDFNILEEAARADGLELRDYVLQEIAGTRSPNASYLSEVKKTQVTGDMYQAIQEYYIWYVQAYNEEPLFLLKYDGSSLVGYYDTNTGECTRVVTAGGSNRTSDGIDWTYKFKRYFPNTQGSGICAIQAECLVALEHGYGETSRQKGNGLVNSKYLEQEVDALCNLRGFRYFQEQGYAPLNFYQVMNGMPQVKNMAGDIKFAGAWVMTYQEIMNLGPDIVNKDIWATPTGTFLVDGVVAYSQAGECMQALKYKDAGRGETTEVLGIKWNDQSKKGKDSWSANAIINPVTVRGSVINKPSVGSISKMVKNGISKGARVTVILANSTIPMIDQVIQAGDLNFEWPVCSCGHQMSDKDIYGALLKCSNPECSGRLARMTEYLNTCQSMADVDLNKLLVIDRFDWNKKVKDMPQFLQTIVDAVVNGQDKNDLKAVLETYITTDLQKKNLNLVVGPAWTALRNKLILP